MGSTMPPCAFFLNTPESDRDLRTPPFFDIVTRRD
jgi:hypothetical protein